MGIVYFVHVFYASSKNIEAKLTRTDMYLLNFSTEKDYYPEKMKQENVTQIA